MNVIYFDHPLTFLSHQDKNVICPIPAELMTFPSASTVAYFVFSSNYQVLAR